MEEATQNEINAMYAGSDAAGQYLESIGKTDMAQMTSDEWMTMIDAVCTGYTDKMRELSGWSLREKEAVPY